ncbi:restriction endonuclease subunit S [Protofrankia coriariae]|uniref:restriction endonuclease subunit S n=1 Tax=Protofrankia coriariae TaxID=1562887 RepID=UPI00069CB565|nr:restriction endonuclease subunit S [Protofrankia coriariae]
MFERIKDVDHPEERMLSVFREYGVVAKDSRDNINKTAENRSIYQLVHPGWLVANRMKAWQGSVGISPLRGIVSGHYICFAPRHGEDARYLNWLLRSTIYTNGYALLSRGVRIGQAEIDNDEFRLMPILLPPLEEQRAIADYLDRETARIDTLIKEQQRLIEMLRERRDSTWAAHVETAKHHGQLVSVRRVIDSIVDGPFGSSLTSAHYSDDGARVVRLGNIGVNEFKDGDTAFIPLDYAAELEAHTVEQGDVVVAGLGDDHMPLGRAAVVPALGQAVVKADCYRLRPNAEVSAAYLAWVMSAPQTRSQIMLLARGSTRLRLNTKVVQQVEIPLTDRGTQDALVTQSTAETVKIDTLIIEAERFIELARERRVALITAAVTGQIDVRDLV